MNTLAKVSLSLIAAVVALALGASCASPAPVDLDDYDRFFSPQESRERYEALRAGGKDGGGSSVRILIGDQLRGERDKHLIFGPSGARFHAEMSYLNRDDDETKDFSLIVLLDFQQVRTRLNGHWDYVHPMLVKPNEEQILSIETDPLADGGHSLLLAFVEPSFPIRGFPPDSGVEALFSGAMKLYLFIGDNASRPATKPLLENVGENPPYRGYSVWIDKERVTQENFIRTWRIENVRPGAEIEFFAHASNNRPDEIAFVMLPMLAYRQPEDMKALYAKVPAGTEHVYSMTLRAPEEEGDYEMFFLWATSLYEYFNLADGADDSEVRRASFDTSNRVIIRVRH